MADNLVIVESPAKAKTISQYLGKKYDVTASMGHVRDLPKSKTGIDTEHNFEPSYTVPVDKKKIISGLKKKIKAGTAIWIATDEDREGEAIGWHLLQALKVNPKKHEVRRIVFHEITKNAILESIKNPREIDMNLVDAQQARRVLDRLVGYELSPLLWKKIRYGLSAGRVQSVAVRLIVEREREIKAFKTDEYWKITGTFSGDSNEKFEALLKEDVGNKKSADKILKDLKGAGYKVASLKEKLSKRNPAPPFITSTLQQEASRKLGFSVKKTMVIAQQLYEGVKTNKGHGGLITYMRTDSFNLSTQAIKQAKKVIEKIYGKEYIAEKTRVYKKAKGAQEAHEAIRPANLEITPDMVKESLDRDQFRLYKLIWERMIACQMATAQLKGLEVLISSEKDGKKLSYIFKATGQTIVFPGFMKLYIEGEDDNPNKEPKNIKGEKLLPPLKEKEDLGCSKIDPTQHFTQPPPRYTEASLVKKLESEGIGRPSTYAPTISTIQARGYIEKEKKTLKPTDTGEVVNDFLVKHFSDIVNYKFTAEMEEDLDLIANGKKKWVPLIRSFYTPFHKTIEEKEKTIKKADVVNEKSDEICEKCGAPMVIKLGRYGKFLSCSNYPTCKNAKPLKNDEEQEDKPKIDEELKRKLKDKKCEKCGAPMEIRNGRYGNFLRCTNEDCKNIQPIIKFMGIKCPKCKEGQLVERRTRRAGKIFYGCNKFPKCKFATWDKPTDKKCKKCGGLMVEKKGKVVCIDCETKK